MFAADRSVTRTRSLCVSLRMLLMTPASAHAHAVEESDKAHVRGGEGPELMKHKGPEFGRQNRFQTYFCSDALRGKTSERSRMIHLVPE